MKIKRKQRPGSKLDIQLLRCTLSPDCAPTHLGSTHNPLTSHLLLLHQLNISSTDCTGTETKESDGHLKKTKKPAAVKQKAMPTQIHDLLLIGIDVEADFVASVQVDVPLHVVRGVGKVEHFLWKVTATSDFCPQDPELSRVTDRSYSSENANKREARAIRCPVYTVTWLV